MATIDLSLDALKIPALDNFTPDFGTMITETQANKGGLSTFEVNSNMMLPWSYMRPKVVVEDSVTTVVEYDAKLTFSASLQAGVTLTMDAGDYEGCEVSLRNLSAYACTVGHGTFSLSIPAGGFVRIIWNGTTWEADVSSAVGSGIILPPTAAAVHAATDVKTLFVKGQIIEGTNTAIKGHGTAEVILINGKAIINFTAKISTAGSGTNVFSWGLSRNALKTLNSNVPTITPTTGSGGTGVVFTSSGAVSSTLTHYGACFQNNNPYWTPARLYDTSGSIGSWPSSEFSVDTMIAGTVYGTY